MSFQETSHERQLVKRRSYGHGMRMRTAEPALDAAPIAVLAGAEAGSVGNTFGRMFNTLLPQRLTDSGWAGLTIDQINAIMAHLGRLGGPMDEGSTSPPVGNSNIPAGYTFLGQFIDHDITFDPVSQLSDLLVGTGFTNFRSPGLDLDSMYGAGPDATPYLYQQTAGNYGKFLIGESSEPRISRHHRQKHFADLPRNAENVALIGDPRNDENLIVSQLHLAFMHFHNEMMDLLAAVGVPTDDLFDAAQAHVRFYYHKVIVDDFLSQLIDPALVTHIQTHGPHYYDLSVKDAYMPLEFSVAAYRYGHSQVRGLYKFNDDKVGPLFMFGASDMNKPTTYVLWKHLFNTSTTVTPVMCRKVDLRLPSILLNLPFFPPTEPVRSLAARNLMRGRVYDLPSGQTIANHMVANGLMAVANVLPPSAEISATAFTETPLWYYVLEESRALGSGNRLGPVGGRIVAEVLLGLIADTQKRLLPAGFTPLVDLNDTTGHFMMPDLLRVAYPVPGAAPFEYRVQPRDTLTRIADKFGTSVADILAINPAITNPDLILVGQIIWIPGDSVDRVWPLS
ncbi:MAG: LysM peptidoglycan-binding domain-containing protein [Anaerolineae bacterium]|nr:LysM peptidoglycan-binding domain-containing protein [Anaerolineae bacterium]